jgi:glycosyltransferase involved in cell wall biosynthesis
MRIALLHYSSPPIVGGVESVLAHHARLMVASGQQVVIFAGRGKIFDERIPVKLMPLLDSRHPEVLHVKTQLDKGSLPAAFDELVDQIKSYLSAELNGFDVLIAHNVASLHKNLALTAAIHAVYQLPGFPRLILWHHDLAWESLRYRPEMHQGYPWDLLRANWSGATQVVVSQVRRQELSELLHIPEDDIHVIQNGVELSTFFKLEEQTLQLVDQLKLNQAYPLLLLPARLTRRKNIELALRTMVELRKNYPHAMLLVTGPEGPHNPSNVDYKKKLIEIRNDLKLQGAAHFLAETTPGFIPDDVIADFYRLADALLFPSFEEGFGIPLLEAAISSKPIFCADIPVLHELGGSEVNYFNPHAAPASIAGQIATLLNNDATSRLARRVKHEYTWESIYKNLIDPLIQEVCS